MLVDTLLDLKKQRLLLSLQTAGGDAVSDTEGLSGGREGGEEPGSGEDEENEDDLQGIKCQAPIKEVYTKVFAFI